MQQPKIKQSMPMLNRSYSYNYEDKTLIAFIPTKIHDSLQYALQDLLEHMVDRNLLSWNQFKRLKMVETSEFSSTCYF